MALGILQQPQHADGRRGVNWFGCAVGVHRLVVEAHIASSDRRIERATGIAHAFDGPDKLPIHLRVVGVAEVETVGDGAGCSAHASNVAGRFCHRNGTSFARIRLDISAVAIHAQRQAFGRTLDLDHSCVTGAVGGTVHCAHHAVVLLVNPPLGREVGTRNQSLGRGHVVLGFWNGIEVEFLDLFDVGWLAVLSLIHRSTTAQYQAVGRNLTNELLAIEIAQGVAFGHHADVDGMKVPLVENGFDLGLLALLDHHQHPLLALAQEDFKRLHILLALGHQVQANVHTDTATTAHLRSRTGDACRSHILHAHHSVAAGELQRSLKQQFLLEGVAHLHCGQILCAVFRDVLRGKRSPLNAVFAGRRTDDVHGIARTSGLGTDDFVAVQKAHAHRVDQRVDLVYRVKVDFPTDDGHTEAVAVIANAADHTVEQPLGLGVVEVTKTERIQLRNGTGTHGEDVPVDAPHSGGRTLVGLQCTRVVVAFDFERTADAIADVDNARVFLSCLHQQMRAVLGQGLQPFDGVFVAAMLGPHHRVDAHLGEVGRAAEDLSDLIEFLWTQAHILGLLEGGRGGGCAVGHVANGSGCEIEQRR